MGIVDAVVSFVTNDPLIEDEIITFFEDIEEDLYLVDDHDDNAVEDYKDA